MTGSIDSVETGSSEQELFDLIARYEDDVLDAAGLARLNELLIDSTQARDIFNDVCLQSLTIGEALSVDVDAVELASDKIETLRPAQRVLSFPLWVYTAAAAIIALIATTYFLNKQETPSLNPLADGSGREIIVKQPLVARLHSKSGLVEFSNLNGSAIEGMESLAMKPGMKVSTLGPESATVLVYPDGTRIELGPDTTASLAKVERKLVLLERGNLRASVQPQAVNKPFGVRTPHLELTVVGTEFLVDADEDDTRIRVLEGHVQVERLSDQSQVELLAGQEVAVANVGELLVASLPPSSPEPLDGGSPSSASGANEPPPIDLTINQRPPVQGVVTLGRPAVLRGRAVDANGRPYSNAKVSLHVNKSALNALAETTTDSQGRFEIQVGVFGELVARVGSAIETNIIVASGQVSELGDLSPDTK